MTKNDFLLSCSLSMKKKQLHHAIIVLSNNQTILDSCKNDFVRVLFCLNNNIEYDNCDYCIKNSYQSNFNIATIDGLNSNIKKEEILKVINRFSHSSFNFSEKKLYVLRNGESLKENAANTLLKFLEEPTKNTFCLILSNDISKILPTIKSRCLLFNITEDVNIKLNDNLWDCYNEKNELKLLKYFTDLKNVEKKEVIERLNYNFKIFILKNSLLAEKILDSINNISISNYYILEIEYLFNIFIKEINEA
ncbi:DNA polymerase III subunit delta' [Spiroplasma turonicum]|uniref:DNA polymerase III subunit delta n=3 Tax=Spiroplasma turonicum TaxID=216946 RepID=A0A0K1P4M9_9MOLU|nr:DNA polymerase III subunit delta' [Spiroplasma turonicum]